MRAIRDIKRKRDQKAEEVQRLSEDLARVQGELSRAEASLEAYNESLKLIQKDSGSDGGNGIRPGSMVHKAKEVLKNAGQPLHVEEMLRRMGKEPTKNNRASLSGSLGTYVRDGNVFTRPQPNTFALVEFEEDNGQEPPDGFGQ